MKKTSACRFKLLSSAAIAAVALTAFGGLRTTGIVEPTSVLKSAYLWLDAADETTFTKNAADGVTAWAGRSDSGIGATATSAMSGGSEKTVYGTVGATNGVPAYLMGEVGSGIDMAFTQTATLRTVFWAMDIATANSAAFFLGCRQNHMDYRRGSKGQYAYAADSTAFANGDLRCDGAKVAQRSAYPPAGLHVYSYAAEQNTYADRLSNDRNVDGSNGGRALSELLLFNETLSTYDRLWVESYLRVKWMDATNVVSSAVTVGLTVFPNLLLDGDAALSVAVDPAPQDGSRPLVLVAGTLAKGTAAKVRLAVPAAFFCASSRVLLKCGAASGISDVSDFEVTGLSDGWSLSWTGTQLVATIVAPPGAETKTLTADEVLEGPFDWAGTLDRGAADKVRVAMPRSLSAYAGRSCTVLSCGASVGIALEDFEIANLPVGAKLAWNGRVLTATYPLAIEPAFLKDDAYLWLDATDDDSFVWTQDRLGVVEWKGKSAGGVGAAATAAKSGGSERTVYGTVGVTNGVPAYLMGATGSGIDMAFTQTATLRSVFWAMDIASNPMAFFLGCRSDYLDYRRGAKGQYANSAVAFANGDLRCDGTSVSPTSYPPEGFHLYSFVASQDTHADRLSNDRNENGSNGGRALSELILVNRALEEFERTEVEKYLWLKWKSNESVTWSAETPCGVGTNVDASVQLDAGAELRFRALPAADATGLTVLGKFCRGTAGKVRFVFPEGTTFDRPVTLLRCATSIGVELDDFEIVGVDRAVVKFWDGRTLTASAGTNVLEPTSVLRRAHLWLDAAASETFTTNAAGGVTAWAGRSDSGYGATAAKAKVGTELVYVYGTVGVTNGVPAYLMGETGCGVDMSFERTTTLRTAFWAMDISSSVDAFFLGDGSHFQFHRKTSTGAYAAGNESGEYGWSKGTIFCDGVNVGDPTSAIPPSGLHVYAGALSQACSAKSLSNDRNQVNRNGGRALSEIALFNEELSERERLMVENYLRVKWTGATSVLSAPVNAPSADAVFPSLDLADGASFTLTNAVGKAEAAITVAGVLTKSAGGQIVIDANGQSVADGATILECASSRGVALSDFDLTSFGERKFSWDGQSLKTVAAKGFTLILR